MYLGIDLGSTNIKAALYDEKMNLKDRKSIPVTYIRENGFVEFDAKAYAENLVSLLSGMFTENGVKSVSEIAFTGQAESLVCVGEDGLPLQYRK
jgi:sugar (pentulose or hexulose) kinase